MTLAAGTKLGPYEILAPLGAGGMGEVYRARDTKLGREVALKVLPDAFAADTQRMARFEREAQVLASLNHPNIATIYGLEESGSARALVMELVEGPTLAERLGVNRVRVGEPSGLPREREALPYPGSGRPIPLDECLQIAEQIAEGLEYAHERGVIHRDLKPANIKLTPEGAVKILDFGLAKALDAAPASGVRAVREPPLQDSPTISAAATQAGVILGTAAYMSPEQAKGKTVDRRADIWAFGCVLYEMLSGKGAFEGETTTDVLAAVVVKEPELALLPADTPAAIRNLLRRCLQKDAKQRLQAIGEARIAIEAARNGEAVGPGLPSTSLPSTFAQNGERQSNLRDGEQSRTVAPALAGEVARPPHGAALQRALPWGFAGLGVLTALIIAGLYFSHATVPAYSIRSVIPAPDDTSFVFVGDAAGPPALSPDGKNLAFVAAKASEAPQLYVRPLGSLEARALSGTDNAWAPFWSPDGRKIGFFAEGKLKITDLQGGTPVSVADAPNGRGGSWSPNGEIVFAPDFRSPIYRVLASGGTPVVVTHLDQSKHTSHRWPYALPDGKHFLYLAINHQTPRDENDAIYYASVDGKENIRLRMAFTNPEYAAGSLLYVRDGTLMVQGFEPSTGRLKEEEQLVAAGVTEDSTTWRAVFTVSSNGLLAYAAGAQLQSQLGWYDRTGKLLGTLGEKFGALTIGDRELRLSPGGDRVALSIQGQVTDVWVMDVARGSRARLSFGPVGNTAPVWSPDGKWVAYENDTKEGFSIVRRPSAGGPEETLLSGADQVYPQDWSSDGKYLLYVNGARGTHEEVWVLPLVGNRKPFQLVPSGGTYMSLAAQFSPDMRWVSYASSESGRQEVYIVPFRGGGGKWEVSTSGGMLPEWRNDGKELFYLGLNGTLMAVPVATEGGQLKLGVPQPLFRTNTVSYDVAPGGKKLLLDLVGNQGSKPITLVTNWTADLRK